jgi:hypothetical protein
MSPLSSGLKSGQSKKYKVTHTWHYVPEDRTFHSHQNENLKIPHGQGRGHTNLTAEKVIFSISAAFLISSQFMGYLLTV